MTILRNPAKRSNKRFAQIVGTKLPRAKSIQTVLCVCICMEYIRKKRIKKRHMNPLISLKGIYLSQRKDEQMMKALKYTPRLIDIDIQEITLLSEKEYFDDSPCFANEWEIQQSQTRR